MVGAGEGNRTLVISLEGCCSTIELHPRREQSSDVVDQVERLSETDLCFSRDGGGGSYHTVEALQWVAPRCGRFGPFDPQPLFLMAPAPSGGRRMSDYWPEPISGNSSGAGSRTTPLSSSAVWDSVPCDRDQANWPRSNGWPSAKARHSESIPRQPRCTGSMDIEGK